MDVDMTIGQFLVLLVTRNCTNITTVGLINGWPAEIKFNTSFEITI